MLKYSYTINPAPAPTRRLLDSERYEDIHLLYVAVTRAKLGLYLPRWGPLQKKMKRASLDTHYLVQCHNLRPTLFHAAPVLFPSTM